MSAKPARPKKGREGRKRPALGELARRAVALGAKRARVVAARSVATAPWVRLKCQYGCGGYGSSLCEDECAFEEGCCHPQKARPAMEACGIGVFATARANGFEIEVVRDHDDPQHYFGAVLVE